MSLIKRSLSIYGHQTSLAIEAQYWAVIDYVAARDGVSISALIKTLDDERVAQKYSRGLAAFIRTWAINLIIHNDHVRDNLRDNFTS